MNANETSQRASANKPARRTHSTLFVILSWALVVAWACFIFYMSSNSGSDLNEGGSIVAHIYQAIKQLQAQILGPGSDLMNSIAHFCEYTVFGALLTNALRCHMPLRRACIAAIACASLYGVSDEIHQLFVPDRSCDPVDWIVDTCGGSLGTGIAYLVLRKRAHARTR